MENRVIAGLNALSLLVVLLVFSMPVSAAVQKGEGSEQELGLPKTRISTHVADENEKEIRSIIQNTFGRVLPLPVNFPLARDAKWYVLEIPKLSVYINNETMELGPLDYRVRYVDESKAEIQLNVSDNLWIASNVRPRLKLNVVDFGFKAVWDRKQNLPQNMKVDLGSLRLDSSYPGLEMKIWGLRFEHQAQWDEQGAWNSCQKFYVHKAEINYGNLTLEAEKTGFQVGTNGKEFGKMDAGFLFSLFKPSGFLSGLESGIAFKIDGDGYQEGSFRVLLPEQNSSELESVIRPALEMVEQRTQKLEAKFFRVYDGGNLWFSSGPLKYRHQTKYASDGKMEIDLNVESRGFKIPLLGMPDELEPDNVRFDIKISDFDVENYIVFAAADYARKSFEPGSGGDRLVSLLRNLGFEFHLKNGSMKNYKGELEFGFSVSSNSNSSHGVTVLGHVTASKLDKLEQRMKIFPDKTVQKLLDWIKEYGKATVTPGQYEIELQLNENGKLLVNDREIP